MKKSVEIENIEKEIVRLGELKKTFLVLANGAEVSDKEALVSAIWYIQGSLDDIFENLDNNCKKLINE